VTRYLLSVHTVEGEPREPMTDDAMREMMGRIGELEEEMNAAGALLYSGRLSDADAASVVRAANGKTLVTDGPFAETKEQLGGFYIVEAEDLEAARSWAAKTSACIGRPIEVRPFFDARGA
jgi:hypothetical protein